MLGAFGWQDYVATDGQGFMAMRKLPPGVPPNLALSLFGITGPTAYFGIIDVGQVKAGRDGRCLGCGRQYRDRLPVRSPRSRVAA